MSSRYSAARPSRAGETFARAHHGDSPSVKFDVRNPSALAPDAAEEDAVLEADVIGTTAGATKRGAVNIDGYDSDSDNDNINLRAEAKHRNKKREVDLGKQFDTYDGGEGDAAGSAKASKPAAQDEEEEDDDDMFAADDDEDDGAEGGAKPEAASTWKKAKEVRFLDDANIQGQEMNSKSGGQVRLDDQESSDEDEEVRGLAIAEEGVDEEVGLGGLKRNAPKLEAFNMKQEQEEGRFDEDGNYVRKAADPDAVHDKWLDGVSKKEIKRAAAAHEKREAEARQLRMEEDSLLTTDLLKRLILRLERGETALEALARLGKQVKAKPKAKKLPKWKLKKQHGQDHGGENGGEGMDVDEESKAPEDPAQVRIKAAIDAITDAADKLLGRDHADIYDEERELLVRQWRRETGEDWVEPDESDEDDDESETVHAGAAAGAGSAKTWEFRWTDGRDGGARQGPFDGPTMKAWQDAGYFGEGVEFRPAGEEGWSRVASFV